MSTEKSSQSLSETLQKTVTNLADSVQGQVDEVSQAAQSQLGKVAQKAAEAVQGQVPDAQGNAVAKVAELAQKGAAHLVDEKTAATASKGIERVKDAANLGTQAKKKLDAVKSLLN